MKKPLTLLVLLTLLLSAMSCKKTVENQQKNIIIEAMTTGVWFVYQYTEAGTDVTAGFSGYEFKFDQNGTVTGTLAASSTPGTWSANISNYSITSQFPSAGDPLQKLNGTWIIKDSYLDFVKAEMTTATGTNQLQLQKKALTLHAVFAAPSVYNSTLFAVPAAVMVQPNGLQLICVSGNWKQYGF